MWVVLEVRNNHPTVCGLYGICWTFHKWRRIAWIPRWTLTDAFWFVGSSSCLFVSFRQKESVPQEPLKAETCQPVSSMWRRQGRNAASDGSEQLQPVILKMFWWKVWSFNMCLNLELLILHWWTASAWARLSHPLLHNRLTVSGWSTVVLFNIQFSHTLGQRPIHF